MKQLPATLRILFALLVLGSGVSRAASYREEVLSDQPAGYWRLGDPAGSTIVTNSGSLGPSADGMVLNGVSLEATGALTGDADTAAYFDGFSQAKIEVPFAGGLNPSAFTVEAWARVTSDSTGYRSPVASRDDSPQKGFIFYATPENEWQFWTGTGVQVGWNAVGGAFVEADTWAHLVGTYDGTNKQFYVNGVRVGANQSAYTPNGARLLRIGASATESPVGDFFFFGDVDEVAVYATALNPERVVAHYRAGSGADPATDIQPQFVVQPSGTNRFLGESITFTALVTGSLPIAYQWKKGTEVIPGATGFSLTLTNLQATDAGSYTVEVSNAAGTGVSEAAVLDVANVSKPAITRQPRPRTVLPGSTATFSVAASGSTEFQYQWTLNDTDISSATNASLTISNVQTANVGTYRVVVTNPAGSTTSDPATLQFPAPATLNYSDTIKQDSPVAYWRLGESSGEVANDEIGSNDGAYLNGVTLGRLGAPANDTNTAAGFSMEIQTKVDVPWSDVLNPVTFTIECWARVTGGAGAYRSPLTSRADFPQRGYIFYATPDNVWQLWTGTGESGWASISGGPVVLDAYTHLVGVYDGVTLYFYVNGVLVGQRDGAFAPNDEHPLRIGGGVTEGDGDFFFEGDIDEVAVFNTALGEDRVLAHYVAGYPLTTPPSFLSQPRSKAVPPGADVTFSISATGGLPLDYQWFFEGQPLSSAKGASLVISNVTALNAGTYHVVVTNAGGSITSTNAELIIPERSPLPYPDLVRAAGPVAYWRLGETSGETAADEIGSNDGMYLEGVTLGVPGAIPSDTNTAAQFARESLQKVDVPWSETINPPVFTAELWARVTGGSSFYRSPLTSRADTPQRGYIIYAEPGNTWQFWSGKGDTTGWDAIPGPVVVADTWTHLAVSYDGTLKHFYVNGIEVGTSTAAFAVNDESLLRIGGGASEGPGDYFFEGDVDEVAVYDKALAPEVIVQHYLAGAPSVETPVLTVARNGNNLVVTWSAGSLEAATSVTGPWQTEAGAASPYTVTPSGEQKFYRARTP